MRLRRIRRRWVAVAAVVVLAVVTLNLLIRPLTIESYRSLDPQTIVVLGHGAPGAWLRVAEVSETESSVTIDVDAFSFQIGPGTAVASQLGVAVHLDAPLGDRTVVDGNTQQVVPPQVAQGPSRPAPEEIESAVRFRTTFGLRADDGWIRAVFDDPSSDDGRAYGVPLLPHEIAAVTNAQVRANAVSDIVAAYAATVPDDWGGMSVDQRTGGTVVARFKANVAEHRARLLAWLPFGAKVDVREATWSEAELRGFIGLVENDAGWFSTIGTQLYAAEIAGLDNRGGVDVRFIGPKATADAAADAIEAHFGDPPWLRAVWHGLPEWIGARGALEVLTVDSAGRPVPSVQIRIDSEDERVSVNTDIGLMTDEHGRLVIPNYPAVAYRVRAVTGDGDVGITVVSEGRTAVPPGGRATIRLTLD